MIKWVASKILGFVGGNQFFLVALLISSIASAGATWKILDWKHGKQIAEMENAAWQAQVDNLNQKNAIDLANNQVATAIAEAYELRNKKHEIVTKYINKEVIKYVQSDIAGKCDLPNQWVRLHDSAARNRITGNTDTTTEPNDLSSGVTDVEVLGVVTDNYQSCHKIRNQLIELQEWARNISNKDAQ